MSAPSSITPPSSNSDDGGLPSGNVKVSIVVFTMVGVVVVVIALLITTYYLRRLKIKAQAAQLINPRTINPYVASVTAGNVGSVEMFLDGVLKDKPIRFTPQNLIDFTNNYSETLGSGGFGTVYSGVLVSGVRVAVKILRTTLDKRAEEQFMAEVGTIGRTYHINLVKLYGFCFDDAVKALVYEYMPNGSLDRLLFSADCTADFNTLRTIAVGTAKGIRYLHEECQQRIVHYDIKPGNVLLSAGFVPKVADFGLAKFCDREDTHMAITGGRGTPGYAAPELWMPFPVTYKCDVYSFGMLLFELVGRRRNLEFARDEAEQWFPRWVWDRYTEGKLGQVAERYGIEGNRTEVETMCKVALWCVQYKPETRPEMSSVVRMLEGDDEIVPPTNPFLHMGGYDAVSHISTSRDTGNYTSDRTSSL